MGAKESSRNKGQTGCDSVYEILQSQVASGQPCEGANTTTRERTGSLWNAGMLFTEKRPFAYGSKKHRVGSPPRFLHQVRAEQPRAPCWRTAQQRSGQAVTTLPLSPEDDLGLGHTRPTPTPLLYLLSPLLGYFTAKVSLPRAPPGNKTRATWEPEPVSR